MQTLQDLLSRKKLSNNTTKTREFLSGKRVKFIGNKSGHNQPIGTVVELSTIGNITTQYYTGLPYTVYFYDVCLLIDETVADIEEAMKCQQEIMSSARKEIGVLESKKKFMQDNNLEVWNEDEYKVYTVLQALKTKKSDIEKAKVIAELIKS